MPRAWGAGAGFEQRTPGPPDPQLFRTVDTRFGLQVQWLWDGCVTAAGIDGQLQAFARAGIGEVVIEPWDGIVAGTEPGISTCAPYLSDAFLGLVRRAAATAGRLGLHLWLYDGNGAGDDTGAVQRVLAAQPDLAARVVERDGDGFLVRPVPGSLDRLRAASTEAVLAAEHDRIVAALDPDLLSVLRGFWKDEPRLPGGVPWTAELPTAFGAMKNRALDDSVLRSLFGGDAATDRANRVAFWSTVARLFGEHHLGTVQRWHHRHGLVSLVQPLPDGTEFRDQAASMGSMPVVQAWADVPGCDMWPGTYTDEALSGDGGGGCLHVQAASWAHLHDRTRVQAEPHGLQGWGLELHQQKALADRLHARGVNLISPAVTHYSYGPSQATFNGDFGPANGPLWRFYDLLQAHLARLGGLLTGAQHVASIAVVHPQTSAWALDPDSGSDDAWLQAALRSVVGVLLLTWRGFDVVNEEVLADPATAVAGGVISRHDHRFSTVVLPGLTTLFPSTVRVLEDLVACGGQVLVVGDAPWQCAVGDDASLSRRVAALLDHPGVTSVPLEVDPPPASLREVAPLVAALDRICNPEVVIASPAPRGSILANECLHVRRGGADVYVITNFPSDDAEGDVGTETGWTRSWVLLTGVHGVAERWDTESGTVTGAHQRAGAHGLWVWLEIPPWGCAVVVVRDAEVSPVLVPLTVDEPPLPEAPVGSTDEAVRLEGPFSVEFEPAALPLVVSHPDPASLHYGDLGARYPGFSGTATYRTTFRSEGGDVHVELGTIRDAVELVVDGQLVARRAWPPYAAVVHGLLAGEHHLEIRVTNTAANAMPGTDHRPDKPWGLFGPVTITTTGA